MLVFRSISSNHPVSGATWYMLVSGRVPIQDLASVSVYGVMLGIFHIAVGLHGRKFYRIMSTLNYEHM